MPPRVAEDATEEDTEELRAEVCLYAEPDDCHNSTNPDEEEVAIHAEDASGKYRVSDVIACSWSS